MKSEMEGFVGRPATIALVGGTGFIGRAVSKALGARGVRTRLIARKAPARLEAHEAFVGADTAKPETLLPALEGCDVVVHLVAILAERGHTFEQVIHHGAQNVAEAAREAGVGHVVYVSALGADAYGKSAYARAKGKAEQAVRLVFSESTIVRPCLVMGKGGGFVRQVDLLTRHAPVMMLPGFGRTRFQPILVEVLSELLADACLDRAMQGRIVDAAGPDILTFEQLARKELAKLRRKKIFVPLPWLLTWMVAHAMALFDKVTLHRVLPEWLLVTPDQVLLLREDNVAGAPENQHVIDG